MSYVSDCCIIIGWFMNDTDDVIHYKYLAWMRSPSIYNYVLYILRLYE
jgi:hypothetical protein